MTEVRMWKAIRKAWPGHAVRTEASLGGVDPGFPDSILSATLPRQHNGWGCGGGAFVELKVWPEELRSMQLVWHIDAAERGAICYVIAYLRRNEYWIGTAEDYHWAVQAKTMPGPVAHLHAALAMVYRRLTGGVMPKK